MRVVLRGLRWPIIAAVNGHAITGGFELALACDMIIASSRAKFADTHARVGILPGWGLSQRLPRLIGIGRAKELSFTGNTLTAAQAYEWGLVNRVVEPEELLPTCLALASDIGPATHQVVAALLADPAVDRLPTVGRLLQLRERFGSQRLEAACARAVRFDDLNYMTVKHILNNGLDSEPLAAGRATPPAQTFVRSAAELVGHLFGGAAWN